jgi:hypothetical protein
MVNYLYRADRWVWEHLAEPLVWKCESLTGRTNFQMARSALCIFAVSALAWRQILENSLNLGWLAIVLIVFGIWYVEARRVEYMDPTLAVPWVRERPMHRIWRVGMWIMVCIQLIPLYQITYLSLFPSEIPPEKWDAFMNHFDRARMVILLLYLNAFAGLLFGYFLGSRPKPPERKMQLVPIRVR